MIGFDMGFGLFQLMFVVVFVLVLGIFIAVFVRSVTQWHRNNQSPRLTVPADVVSRRTRVSGHGGAGEMHNHFSSSTYYYATFQVRSGDRIELQMTGQQYGMLAEGDRGELTFQGTRFLDFVRK